MSKSDLDFHAFDVSQVMDSPCSPSSLSVPCDLGKWLSSYAYESPSLDMSQSSPPDKNYGIGSSFPTRTVHDKTGLIFERDIETEGAFLTCNNDVLADTGERSFVGYEEQNDQYVKIPDYSSPSPPSEPPDIGTWFSSYAYESSVSDTSEVNIAAPEEDDYITGYKETDEQSLGKLKDHVICGENKPFENEYLPENKEDLQVSGNKIKGNEGDSSDKEANCKGNGEGVMENGFVSTRKDKISKSDIKGCDAWISGSSVRFSEGEECGVVKRRELSDFRNLRGCCDEEEMKVGKWRCPQKNKPNVVPPLKQLRLERWVHRL